MTLAFACDIIHGGLPLQNKIKQELKYFEVVTWSGEKLKVELKKSINSFNLKAKLVFPCLESHYDIMIEQIEVF